MKISYRQSGGFAGVTKGVDLDVETLPPDEAAVIRQHLPRLRAASQAGAGNPPRPDVQQIMVEVSDPGQTSRLHLDERQVPDDLKPLIQLLSAKAQYLKR